MVAPALRSVQVGFSHKRQLVAISRAALFLS